MLENYQEQELFGTWELRGSPIILRSGSPSKFVDHILALCLEHSKTNPTQPFYFYLYSLVLSNILRTLILPSFYLSLYCLIIPPYILNHALLFNHSLSRFCTVPLFLYAYDGSLHSWYSALCKQHCTIVIMLAEAFRLMQSFVTLLLYTDFNWYSTFRILLKLGSNSFEHSFYGVTIIGKIVYSILLVIAKE